MAKNRDDRRGPVQPIRQSLPGGEAVGSKVVDDGVGVERKENMLEVTDVEKELMQKVMEQDVHESYEKDIADAVLSSTAMELKHSDKNGVERAQMHLTFLIQEVSAIAGSGALVGLLRRACAENQLVFNDSNAALWSPLKSVQSVLDTVKRMMGA